MIASSPLSSNNAQTLSCFIAVLMSSRVFPSSLAAIWGSTFWAPEWVDEGWESSPGGFLARKTARKWAPQARM